MKASVNLALLDIKGFVDYCRPGGHVLARAHARTGDPIATAAYLGDDDTLELAVEQFAVRYADQTIADHRRLESAVRSGEIAAEPGA